MLLRKTFMAALAASSLFLASLNSAPALAADPTCTITITQSGSQVDGTNNADVICIIADNVTVNALGGNDTIVDNGNNNTIYMGDGNDVFVPGT
jgi:Ca2+-binding RTX toxin-like protein